MTKYFRSCKKVSQVKMTWPEKGSDKNILFIKKIKIDCSNFCSNFRAKSLYFTKRVFPTAIQGIALKWLKTAHFKTFSLDRPTQDVFLLPLIPWIGQGGFILHIIICSVAAYGVITLWLNVGLSSHCPPPLCIMKLTPEFTIIFSN